MDRHRQNVGTTSRHGIDRTQKIVFSSVLSTSISALLALWEAAGMYDSCMIHIRTLLKKGGKRKTFPPQCLIESLREGGGDSGATRGPGKGRFECHDSGYQQVLNEHIAVSLPE